VGALRGENRLQGKSSKTFPLYLLDVRGPCIIMVAVTNGMAQQSASTAADLSVSTAEVAFFLREGYLILRRVLDPALLKAATDRVWEVNPVSRLRRVEPTTWLAPFSPDEASPSEDHQQRSGMSWRCREVANEELFLDLLPRRLFPLASRLAGEGTLVWPAGRCKPGANFGHPGGNFHGKGSPGQACRGVYCVLPSPHAPRSDVATTAHVDGWAGDRWRLSCHCFLGDAAAGVAGAGGGFGIWPGSHRQLWHTHRGVSYSEAWGRAHLTPTELAAIPPDTWVESTKYLDIKRHILETVTPVDCALSPGDVVIWHHRLIHTGGGWQNLSPQIRMALYVKSPCAVLTTLMVVR
jgi:hypothetical protein